MHKQCGKYRLVFMNTDLQENDTGIFADPPLDRSFIHAQGTFFIQFQVVGAGSHEVTRLSFSFGAYVTPADEQRTLTCTQEALPLYYPDNPAGYGVTGAYLLYYRSDFEPKDGFFVPIKTTNVPDTPRDPVSQKFLYSGTYGAAVHAYKGDCNSSPVQNGPPVSASCVEVARAWTKAVVDNCPTLVSGTSTTNCPQSPDAAVIAMDHTLPWPMILPGDGNQTNNVEGLTVEFPEPLAQGTTPTVFYNGEAVNLTAWTTPWRDDDLVPLNDNMNCPNTENGGVAYVCSRLIYGPGFKWEYDNITEGDIIRVVAKDRNNNLLDKTVHYGGATSGGAVDLLNPKIQMQALNGQEVIIRPGDRHEFNLRFNNIGQGEAHVDLLTDPADVEGLTMRWSTTDGKVQDHVVVPAGAQVTMKLLVSTATNAAETHYNFLAVARYDVEGVMQKVSLPYLVDVNKDASPDHEHAHGEGIGGARALATPTNNTTATKKAKGGLLPDLGAAFALGLSAAVLVAVAMRRRFDS